MSITIVKIKLLNNGMKGMQYHAEDPIIKKNIIIKGFITKNYPIPIPKDIRDLIQRMKRYLLHLTGYWKKDYDQYIHKGEIKDIADPSQDYYDMLRLFQNTRIEELSRFKGVYKIIGYYLNEWKQSIKLEVNGVTIDTGYTDYDKLDAGMKHIFDSITGFINEDKLRMMDSRQYMLDLWEGKSEMTARLDGLDDEQTNELQAKILEEKGYIVIKQEDSPEEEEEEEDGLDVITIETEDDDDEKFEDI